MCNTGSKNIHKAFSKGTEGAPETNDLFTYSVARDTLCVYLLEGKKC